MRNLSNAFCVFNVFMRNGAKIVDMPTARSFCPARNCNANPFTGPFPWSLYKCKDVCLEVDILACTQTKTKSITKKIINWRRDVVWCTYGNKVKHPWKGFSGAKTSPHVKLNAALLSLMIVFARQQAATRISHDPDTHAQCKEPGKNESKSPCKENT
jgi:hypothetical protein